MAVIDDLGQAPAPTVQQLALIARFDPHDLRATALCDSAGPRSVRRVLVRHFGDEVRAPLGMRWKPVAARHSLFDSGQMAA